MHIVLYEPEIPQNTGNIARTCAATGSVLHLIEPLGFDLSDKYLKRAGLDYWHMMEMHVHSGFDDLIRKYPDSQYYFATTKAAQSYHEVVYDDNCFLVFGCETKGLPESLLKRVYDRCIRIPMIKEARSLNLSNSVAVILFEALRQQQFRGLKDQGSLTGREDSAAPWMDYV